MQKGIFVIGAILVAVLLLGCTQPNPSPAPGPGASQVNIQNMSFSPQSLTVTAGTTVTWTNNDNVAHTVTSDAGAFDSGSISPGKTYSHTFSTAGTYPYHCTIHPFMTASITVQ